MTTPASSSSTGGSHGPDAQLSIGTLAAASGLSPKALRLYDESGLLPPSRVDPVTGYRFYDSELIGRARLIAALRGVGMPLSRIATVCALPEDAARVELRSWWRQEQADVLARHTAVTRLLTDLTGGSPAAPGHRAPCAPSQETTHLRAPPPARRVTAASQDMVVK